MPVKVLDDAGSGSTESVVAGIAYAVAGGARVINLSVNGPDHSTALDEAIRGAEAAGVTVVASAGNDGADRVALPSYPASSAAGNVIAVAAGSRDGGITATSAWGRDAVDLAAPGESVLSTALGGGYRSTSGTSVAAAHVSGAVALLAAAKPDSSVAELRAALLGGAHRLRRDGWRVGAGGLDADGAVARMAPSSRPRIGLRARVRRLGRRGRVALRWRAVGPTRAVASYRVRLNGRLFVTSSTASRPARTARRVRLRPGRHRLRVTALDASGRPLVSRTFRPRVLRPRHQR